MKKLVKWIRYHNLDIGTRVEIKKDKGGVKRCYITTDMYIYSVVANKSRDYMGCVSTCRKTKVGETHLRGSDLPDGKYTKKTFISIMCAIVRNEARGVKYD